MGKPAVRRESTGRLLALQIIGIYLLVGAAWVFSARSLLFHQGIDPTRLPLLHALEGWAFLLSTALLFYLLISRHLRAILLRRAEEIEALITERRLAEEKVQNLAFFDTLTGLPNRRLLIDRLHQALAQARREGSLVGLAFLDLDHFKTINDTLGHGSGDALLRAVAERLQDCVRKSDTVARLGGDEFVLVLPSLEHADDAAAIARKVLEVFAHPFRLEDREIFATTSIGLALFPLDAEAGEELLSRADMAMYRAKERGRNLYQFFAPQMNEEAVRRLALHNELSRGLRRGELFLFFQEKVNLETGAIIGLEALLRWRHPERGLLRPAEFLPLAEESGLIIPIGEWVLRTACAQGMAWQRMGLPPLRIAVNVSGRQLRHGDLVETVRRVLEETGLPPARLELEFREESLLDESAQAPATLAALRQLGVTCALDDFGTGLSAIGRIRTLPLDRLNIHHSLVHNFAAAEEAGLIRGIVGLAHDLHLRVIAEGVETAEQKSFLLGLGCDEVQGSFFRLPVPAEEMTELLQQQTSLTRSGSWPDEIILN